MPAIDQSTAHAIIALTTGDAVISRIVLLDPRLFGLFALPDEHQGPAPDPPRRASAAVLQWRP